MVPSATLLAAALLALGVCSGAPAQDARFEVDTAGGINPLHHSAMRGRQQAAERRLNNPKSGGFIISAGGAACTHPSLASLGSQFMVVFDAEGLDWDQTGIFGQLGTAKALTGEPFQINTVWADRQEDPSVAALDGGGAVAVWASMGEDASSWSIQGQMLSDKGAKVGKQFQVNTAEKDSQKDPMVAQLDNGGFVVVWRSYGQDGSGAGVYAQRFDKAGAKVDKETQVNQAEQGNQEAPAVAGLPGGGFVVVWQTVQAKGGASDVVARSFDGKAWDAEAVINSMKDYTLNTQPYVAPLIKGAYVIVWAAAADAAATNTAILGQVFAAAGDPEGANFKANTGKFKSVRSSPAAAAVESRTGGDLVVAWVSTAAQDGDGSGAYGQVFKRTKNAPAPVLFEFAVNDNKSGEQAGVRLATLADGTMVAAYESAGAAQVPQVDARPFAITDNPADVCAETGATCTAEVLCCDVAAGAVCAVDGYCLPTPEETGGGDGGNFFFKDGKLTTAGIAIAASAGAVVVIATTAATVFVVRKRRAAVPKK